MRLLIDTTTVLDVVIVIVLVMAITLTRATDTLSSLVTLDHMRISPVCLVVTELTLLAHRAGVTCRYRIALSICA